MASNSLPLPYSQYCRWGHSRARKKVVWHQFFVSYLCNKKTNKKYSISFFCLKNSDIKNVLFSLFSLEEILSFGHLFLFLFPSFDMENLEFDGMLGWFANAHFFYQRGRCKHSRNARNMSKMPFLNVIFFSGNCLDLIHSIRIWQR